MSLSPTSPVPAELSDQPSDTENMAPGGATGASRELDICILTPTKRGENSEDIEAGANALMDAADKTDAFNIGPVGGQMVVGEDNQTPADVEDQLDGLNLDDWSSDLSRQSCSPSARLNPSNNDEGSVKSTVEECEHIVLNTSLVEEDEQQVFSAVLPNLLPR